MDVTTSRPLTIEERLDPWLASAEYVLVLVLCLMLWTAGFVDLFSHTSADAPVLGAYSVPFAALLVVYSLGFPFWLALIIRRDGVSRLKAAITFIQERAWLGIGILLIFAAVIVSMFRLETRWAAFPLLEISLLLLMLIVTGLILLARPNNNRRIQLWRKIVIAVLGSLIAIEILLQIAAVSGLLRVPNTSGLYLPYGRVYVPNSERGLHVANRYGLYYPDTRLLDGANRLVILGDRFVQGLEVNPEENLGVTLEKRMADDVTQSVSSQVLSLGLPGYGPGLYLDDRLYPYIWDRLKPNEIIVLFHLANDFQVATEPGGPTPYYEMKDGVPTIHETDFGLRHNLEHVAIRGFEPNNPVQTLQSHLFILTPLRAPANAVNNMSGVAPIIPENIELATEDQPFGLATFLFEKGGNEQADNAIVITTGLLDVFRKRLDEEGVTLRLVTIPYFPSDFYSTYTGDDWTADMGEYDLFHPERALEEYAQEKGISFLPMGAYMQLVGLSVEEIRALYLENGIGHFTAQGHDAFARAIYDCFYSQTQSSDVALEALGCSLN